MASTTAAFAFHKMQTCKILKLNLPVRKVGPDLVRTADVIVEVEGANDLLNLFDDELLDQLYRASEEGEAPEQSELDGIEVVSSKPLLRSTSIRMPLALSNEYIGYRMTVDYGMGGKGHDIVDDEVTVKGISVNCKEGGTTRLLMHLQTKNLSDEEIGRLSGFVKRETKLKLEPPKMRGQTDIVDDPRGAVRPLKDSTPAAKTSPAKPPKKTNTLKAKMKLVAVKLAKGKGAKAAPALDPNAATEAFISANKAADDAVKAMPAGNDGSPWQHPTH